MRLTDGVWFCKPSLEVYHARAPRVIIPASARDVEEPLLLVGNAVWKVLNYFGSSQPKKIVKSPLVSATAVLGLEKYHKLIP